MSDGHHASPADSGAESNHSMHVINKAVYLALGVNLEGIKSY
jgi:hypothetical protein